MFKIPFFYEKVAEFWTMPVSFRVNRPWWMKCQESVSLKRVVDLVSVGWEEGFFVCVLTPDSGIVFCLCQGSNSNTELEGGGFNSGSYKALEHLI